MCHERACVVSCIRDVGLEHQPCPSLRWVVPGAWVGKNANLFRLKKRRWSCRLTFIFHFLVHFSHPLSPLSPLFCLQQDAAKNELRGRRPAAFIQVYRLVRRGQPFSSESRALQVEKQKLVPSLIKITSKKTSVKRVHVVQTMSCGRGRT